MARSAADIVVITGAEVVVRIVKGEKLSKAIFYFSPAAC
jgi:hypothetical protein